MDRIAGFYRFLWPFLAADEAQVGWLDENTGGRPNRAFLAEIPVRYGIGPGMTLLDLGCGKGRETCELAKQLGCRVIGVDALKGTLELARARICREGLLGQVTLAEKRCQDPLLVLQQRVLTPFLRPGAATLSTTPRTWPVHWPSVRGYFARADG